MKKLIFLSIFCIFAIGAGVFYFLSLQKESVVSPIGKKIFEKPLEKYTFKALKAKNFKASEISIGKLLKEGDGFTSYVFFFKDQGKRVSGMMNVPTKTGTYPVVAMFRGYVDKEKYTIGEGTRHSAEVIAQNGFITLAPDYLGYGESDNPSNNSIEERFQSYTTSLSLLASLTNLNKALESIRCKEVGGRKWESRSKDVGSVKKNLTSRFNFQFLTSNFSFLRKNQVFASDETNCIKNSIKADPTKVGIWGHSNGGHIALSVLEISGKNYPTVLWNPVSKPFPYSILYFTDEFDDHGKALRRVVANFEKDYDIEKYSPTNYFSWINAPIQLNQGTDDESVPLKWSSQLNDELLKLKKDITYYTYPGENHNFGNGSWPLAIQRAISFYKQNL